MFGLFKSGPKGVKVVDKVWMTEKAKLNACAEMLRLNSSCLFVAWFEETFTAFQRALDLPESTTHLFRAQELSIGQVQDRMVVFIEHYPLPGKEQNLFATVALKEVPVLSSLDEPLFQHFGGTQTVGIMKRLAMNEDEVIGHSMITKSIHKHKGPWPSVYLASRRRTPSVNGFHTM